MRSPSARAREALQDHDARAVREQHAVAVAIERAHLAAARQPVQLREQDRAARRERERAAARDHVLLAEQQRLDPEVDRIERRRARGIDHHRFGLGRQNPLHRVQPDAMREVRRESTGAARIARAQHRIDRGNAARAFVRVDAGFDEHRIEPRARGGEHHPFFQMLAAVGRVADEKRDAVAVAQRHALERLTQRMAQPQRRQFGRRGAGVEFRTQRRARFEMLDEDRSRLIALVLRRRIGRMERAVIPAVRRHVAEQLGAVERRAPERIRIARARQRDAHADDGDVVRVGHVVRVVGARRRPRGRRRVRRRCRMPARGRRIGIAHRLRVIRGGRRIGAVGRVPRRGVRRPRGARRQRLAAQRQPAVGDDDLARHPARGIGREKQHDVGEIVGGREPFQRRRRDARALRVVRIGKLRGDVAVDQRRRCGVHANVARRIFDGEIARQRFERGLRGADHQIVRRHERRADRRHVDDRAAARALDQRGRAACAPERALQVRVERAVEMLGADRVDAEQRTRRRVVDEHVEPPVAPLDLVEHPVDLRLLRDRRADHVDGRTERAQLGGRLLRRVQRVKEIQNHVCALLGEPPADRLAHVLGAARHENELAAHAGIRHGACLIENCDRRPGSSRPARVPRVRPLSRAPCPGSRRRSRRSAPSP